MFAIAIDGPAGAGKSSVAKAAADSVLLDTSDLDFDGAVQRLLEIVRERS